MLDKEKQLKFPDGSKTEVVIKSMGMEQLEFGSEYVVRIQETIDGHDHFKPSDGLQRKMAENNLSEGDKLVIEKVAPSEKYQYGYFSIEMADSPVNKVEMDKYATGEIKAVEPDKKLELHELVLRIEALEKEVAELKKNAIPF